MSVLIAIYCLFAGLFLYSVDYQLQPSAYEQTHTSIRQNLGDYFMDADGLMLLSHDQFWDWFSENLINTFYSADPQQTGPTYFQNYIEVWNGLLIYQWKRNPPSSCAPNKICYGPPAYTNANDIFGSGLELVLEAHKTNQTEFIDYYWFSNFHKIDLLEIVETLREENWLNGNTSRVYIVLMLFNPSQVTTTSLIISVEWFLGGLTQLSCETYSFSNVLNDFKSSTGMVYLQIISFIGILVVLIFEGVRAYQYSKRGVKDASLIFMMVGIFLSSLVTIAIIAEWVMLFTVPSYSGNLELENNVNFQNYIQTIKKFRSIYTFLMSYRLLITINVILFVTRLLSLLSEYDAFNLINSTLEVAVLPTIMVLTYTLISLLSVAAITTINFGPDTTYFSVFWNSLLTLVRFLSMGDFSFDDIESSQVNPTLFIIFYICFIIYGVCILLNLFLAIIYDAFDASQLKHISFQDHGSQIRRTFYIIKHWLWPASVLKMLGNPKSDAVFSVQDLESFDIAPNTIENLLKIYGSHKSEEEEEEEEEGPTTPISPEDDIFKNGTVDFE